MADDEKRFSVDLALRVSVQQEMVTESDGSRSMVMRTLFIQPSVWSDLPMAGVLAIQLQYLQGFIIPMIRIGAIKALADEIDPRRRDFLNLIVNDLNVELVDLGDIMMSLSPEENPDNSEENPDEPESPPDNPEPSPPS
jgi:hypothetical protein